jgi:amino acid adenylation domain-containing protein
MASASSPAETGAATVASRGTPVLVSDILDAAASRHPERTALRRGETAWTYATLRQRSVAYAAWLRAAGVGRGDRVMIAHPRAIETVAMLFAAARVGAMYVITGDAIPRARMHELIADCEPRVVIADARSAPAAGPPPVALGDLPDPGETSDALPASPALSVDPVSLIYTSGSTAAPKAIVSTHRQVVFAARAIHGRLGYRADDVVFSCLPLSFDYGLYQVFLSCLAGAELVLGDEDDAGPRLLARLSQRRATVLPAVPTLAVTLRLLAERHGPPACLRMMTSSGAVLPPDVPGALRALIPGLDVILMFGLTECKRVAVMEPNGDLLRPGAAGRALPDTEFYVVDGAGRRLPAGEVGELVVRGPHVMAGYWRAPQLSAARFRHDEFGESLLFTGDQCRVDEDGYLYFVGRADDIYKQHGYRVSTIEVEMAAAAVPGVQGAAVLPPTPQRGSLLLVSGKVAPGDVLAVLRARLEEYKLPERCLVLDDLPLGPNGKVDKKALAALSQADASEGTLR